MLRALGAKQSRRSAVRADCLRVGHSTIVSEGPAIRPVGVHHDHKLSRWRTSAPSSENLCDMGWAEDEQKLDCVHAALRASRQKAPFPELVGLPDLVLELRSWINDDRQYRHASAASWKSLLRDVKTSLEDYPTSVVGHAADKDELLDELQQSASELAEKNLRREELLRRRVRRFCDLLETGLTAPEARTAAWNDLLSQAASPRRAEASARRLFDMTAWAGLDTDSLDQALRCCLEGEWQHPIASAGLRLSRAGNEVSRDPNRGSVAVWLRLLFAQLHSAELSVGPRIQIFQASWLAPRFAHPDAATPPDVANDDGSLRSLCRADELLNTVAPGPAPHVETPWALVRIDIPDATTAEAVGRARRTAATLGAVGTLYGGEPSLWRVDGSYVTFREGKRSAGSFMAPIVESATFVERVAVGRDPTPGLLRHNATELSKLLPVRPGRMDELAQLMLWLREARSAPPPARLVLCDRAIETVSGWAGVATPRRFVEMFLIPSWSRRQMLGEFRAVAIDIYYNGQGRRFPAGHPQHEAWAEVVLDSKLRLRDIADGDIDALKSLIANVHALLGRLPADHPNRDQVQRLVHHVASPKAALNWLASVTQQGMVSEARRSRTRNALVHGGPLSEPTVGNVIVFAQYMADESLARTLEAFMNGDDACTAFMALAQRGGELRRRLRAGQPVCEALTWF